MYDVTQVLDSLVYLSDMGLKVQKAYLDPSTGAMIISAIVGIFATIILALKTFWYKIVSLFRKKNTISPNKK